MGIPKAFKISFWFFLIPGISAVLRRYIKKDLRDVSSNIMMLSTFKSLNGPLFNLFSS